MRDVARSRCEIAVMWFFSRMIVRWVKTDLFLGMRTRTQMQKKERMKKKTTTPTTTAANILALYNACRAVFYLEKKKKIHKRWTVFSFSAFFSLFLGSEEFYLCNIAIWPIQKQKKHTDSNIRKFSVSHTHAHTYLGCRILSPESLKERLRVQNENFNLNILFIMKIQTK